MADVTPSRRLVHQLTPGTGRQKSVARTPQSTLTPNDDAAERASTRRKRQSEALRMSLADTFAGQADQRQHGSQGAAAPGGSKPTLGPEAMAALFEQCIRLAAENKITDRNVWQLNLISHLPDIVVTGSGMSSTRGFNFQKMSGGLDAGVTIYSKRVDLTYKEAFMSLSGGPSRNGDGDDDPAAGEDGCEDDALDDAAAAAARAGSKAGGKRGRGQHQGGAADEEGTLAAPDALRAKKGVDTSFGVDPLFHTMSALFDEGGAKGLLLLNRSVFGGAHIMTAPHDVPEQQFPLEAPAQADELLDLKPLAAQLAAAATPAAAGVGSDGGGCGGPGTLVLTPGLAQLYALLEQSSSGGGGGAGQAQRREQEACGVLDAAGIMQQATCGLVPTPMPGKVTSSSAHSQSAHAAARAAGGSEQGCAEASAMDADAAGQDGGADAAAGVGGAGAPVVAAFLASCEATAAAEDAAAAGAFGLDGDAAGADFDDGHEGYGDDDGDGDDGFGGGGGGAGSPEFGGSWGPDGQRQQQQQARRQSMLGLGGGADSGAAADGDVLDAEALQQLLSGSGGQGGGVGGSRGGATTQGAGWAGSRFWRYRSAAAAAARMAGGGGVAAPVKRAAAAAAAAGGRSKAAAFRIDFTCPPEGLREALAAGSRRQTCLLSAASSSAAATLLPEDLHYQAASLAQLFLRPCPISALRQQHHQAAAAAGAGALSSPAGWGGQEDGDGDDGGGWGGEGYGDDGDGGGGGGGSWGGEGYNAGDLSVGDPGYTTSGGGSGSGADWWSAEGGELLCAPRRATGLGVSYQRAAKQVDVRALKDIVWTSLVDAHSSATAAAGAATGPHGGSSGSGSGGSDAPPVAVPFADVIQHVPEQSAAGPLADVSVHMCFICLLHLANERGLVIRGREDLTTLTIGNVPEVGAVQEEDEEDGEE